MPSQIEIESYWPLDRPIRLGQRVLQPQAFKHRLADWLKDKLYFPFLLFALVQFAVLAPVTLISHMTNSNITKNPIYDLSLGISNPIASAFNTTLFLVFPAALAFSIYYAYSRMRYQNKSKGLMMAIGLGSLIMVGTMGILLARSIATLGFLFDNSGLCMLSIMIGGSSTVLIINLKRLIRKVSRTWTPISYCLEEFRLPKYSRRIERFTIDKQYLIETIVEVTCLHK